jgi:hypothetical protein
LVAACLLYDANLRLGAQECEQRFRLGGGEDAADFDIG